MAATESQIDLFSREIARIEAECGCELPFLENPTLRNRARRVLDCNDPPRGSDEELCLAIVAD